MRVLLTGGTGKAGHHVVPYLLEQGHTVTNLDRRPLGLAGVQDLTADLTDLGQVVSAMRMPASPDDLDLPGDEPIPPYDAVVHLAAIPRPWLSTDAETYANNVLSTYHVLEAAEAVGIGKVVFASSETTYGICFGRGDRRPEYVPVDEEHPVVPEDAYAMAKVANEVTARSFQRRTGADVYGLRINNVIEPHEYAELFPGFLTDPAQRRRNLFAYIDVRDLAQAIDRCLTTDGLGFEVFNIANADHSVAATTDELVRDFYDGVEVRREMGERETFFCIDKAREQLGYTPQHSWRDVLADPRG
ncbi:nucleoside-diphosphate-sugar epimerase [Marmoricola endophyticus]|uniref:Nucleoside-diphosphate-sugar epimerase n=1 Tax=Marmoricola endophyticus TaxID=2040280 RepID=A0A917F661_9ACTN|nr:NAD(P)-dependent oxidoreductase [Marmoricola endophyticus]GGF55084.1 nucleoside-diphosphate-sugar epimerase [Marmoricola endophyticus]